MKICVCLSAGRHPASGRGRMAPSDRAALELALRSGAEVQAVHVGSSRDPVLIDYLGMGLSKILVLDGENRDAVAVLSDALKRLAPDLVLTGTVAESGGCSGLVPYMLSASLGWPVIANVTAFDAASEALRVTQAVAGGHRRQYEGRCPAVLSVAAGAASPRMSALAARRRGSIEVLATAVSPIELPAIDTRPARKRGARIRPGKSSPKSTGVPIVDLDAKAAAQLIIEDLRAHGFMGAPQTDKTESKLHV